jgi:hypothetical protein
MTLIIIVAACALLAVILRNRPVVWLSIALGSTVLLPRAATREWLTHAGALAAVNPSVWMFLAGTIVTLLSTRSNDGDRKQRLLRRLIMAWVVVCAFVIGLLWGSPTSFLVQYAAPLSAFFAMSVAVSRRDRTAWGKVARFALILAVAEAFLAIAQRVLGDALVFEEYYSTFYWWTSTLHRALGTMDSPLDLAAFLTMALPLVTVVRRTTVAIAISAALASGVVASGSRVGIIIAAVVLAWVLVTHSRNAAVGAFIAVCLSAATILFLTSDLAHELLDRFGERGEASSSAREDAFRIGTDLVWSSPLVGNGPGYAYGFSLENLVSSFENAYLATAIDYGLVFVATMLALQILAVLSGRVAGLTYLLPGAVAIVWGFAYSAFLSTNSFGVLSWFFVGISSLAGIGASRRRSAEQMQAGVGAR